jgi:hypothetical protein
MNTVLLDVLTDTEIRSAETLEAAVQTHASAGLPWLTVQD